ncbi:MAG: metallopeptidase TldD-related protein [Candidatus Odinarchaeota archaeon]
MLDILEQAIDKGRNLGATYIEIRGESGFIEYIQMDDSRVAALTQRLERGVAIRALADGAWGFVTTGNLELLDKGVSDAVAMAKAAARSRKEPIKLAEVRAYEDVIKSKPKRDPRHVPIEEKIEYMNQMTKTIRDYDPRVTAVTIKIRTSSGTKYLVTSEGTKIQSPTLLVWTLPWASGKDGIRLSAARYEDATTDEGWEFFERIASPEVIGTAVAKRLKQQLDGVAAKSGVFPCVCGPRVIGTLAHEALGHLAEADITMNSSFAGKLGQVVASEGVNMTDNGINIGRVGVSKYDDEGVPASRVEIIKDSVLTELLTNREYAAKINHRTTGNARAESYLFPPIIRMRSTIFELGEHSREEVFEGIKFGYYCTDFRGGQAQTNASFQVGIQEAYEIVNGELGRPVTDLSISGIATDSLFKIEAVSKEPFPYDVGRCGKGQEAFVSSGGPDIRFGAGGITFGGKS